MNLKKLIFYAIVILALLAISVFGAVSEESFDHGDRNGDGQIHSHIGMIGNSISEQVMRLYNEENPTTFPNALKKIPSNDKVTYNVN